MNNGIARLAQDLATGALRVVDLTHTLSPEFPALQLPPQFGQAWAFRSERISHYDDAGPAWYWNNFSCGEHTGTHFDAPVHWVTGKDHPNNTVDTIAAHRFVAPAVVVDASAEVAANDDWVLTVEFLQAWEARHGRIPAGAWVLFRTDWSHRIADPAKYVNMRDDGAHTPGPAQATVEWLIRERDVHGFGVETINTDAGQSYAWPMPYPCHTLMHGANKFGLQCLRNLDQLPATGALIVAAPLKIKGGSGSPLRVLALVGAAGDAPQRRQAVNPPAMYDPVPFGFSHAALQRGGRTLHLAGQVAWNAQRELVGAGDLGVQARQALANLRAVLAACGAAPKDVVRLRTYVVDHSPDKLGPVTSEIVAFYDGAEPAPNTWIGVQSLAMPEFLVEIEATAVIPDAAG